MKIQDDENIIIDYVNNYLDGNIDTNSYISQNDINTMQSDTKSTYNKLRKNATISLRISDSTLDKVKKIADEK